MARPPLQRPAVPYTVVELSRVADLNIDSSGSVKGTARFVLTGQEAPVLASACTRNDESEVKKQFNESIRADLPDGVQADFDHFLGLDQYDSTS